MIPTIKSKKTPNPNPEGENPNLEGENPQNPGPGENPQNPEPGENPQNPGSGENPQNPEPGENPQNPGSGENPQNPGSGENPQNPGSGENPQNSEPGENSDDTPKEVNEVNNLISQIPTADEITLENEDLVKQAREKYVELTSKHPEYIRSILFISGLLNAESRLRDIKEFIRLVDLLDPKNITDKETINEAYERLCNLSEYQKKSLPKATIDKYNECINALEELDNPVKEVQDLIDWLNFSFILDSNESNIEEARRYYDRLTEEEKSRVNTLNLEKYEHALNAIVLIRNLPDPDNLKLSDKEKVDNAYNALAALSRDEWNLIPEKYDDKIKYASQKISDLEKEERNNERKKAQDAAKTLAEIYKRENNKLRKLRTKAKKRAKKQFSGNDEDSKEEEIKKEKEKNLKIIEEYVKKYNVKKEVFCDDLDRCTELTYLNMIIWELETKGVFNEGSEETEG